MSHAPLPPDFPFWAGQHTDHTLGNRHVLSPLPVHTNLPCATRCDLLVKKTPAYIELGGAGGMIFQTQIMWMLFLMSLIIPVGYLWIREGPMGIYEGFFRTRFIDGEAVRYLDYGEMFVGLGGFFVPMLAGWSILYFGIHRHARRILTQTLPVRFHRQRREVMFSRWNEDKKLTEYRFFPWEQVCAMVGRGSGVSSAGVMSSANLLIGVNDDEAHGHLWSSLLMGSFSHIQAASMWEMIRRFMEEGPDAIGQPAPLTYEAVKADHCKLHDIPLEEFGFWHHLWWALNGTLLGIARINYETKRMVQHADSFADIAAWSEPLPEADWAKPSAELNYYNAQLAKHDYARGRTLLQVGDVRQKFPWPGNDAVSANEGTP